MKSFPHSLAANTASFRAFLFGTIAILNLALLSANASAADAEAGQRLARAQCSRCHAIGRAGVSPNPTSPPFRELSKRYPLGDLEEAFAEGVYVGHFEMQRFVLTPRQIADLVTCLRNMQSK